MTDERLLARLRGRGNKDTIAAADRIEALTAKLAKALGIGNKMAKSIEGNYYIPGVVKEWRATISDLKQEGSKT
jgi:hypothetical protein